MFCNHSKTAGRRKGIKATKRTGITACMFCTLLESRVANAAFHLSNIPLISLSVGMTLGEGVIFLDGDLADFLGGGERTFLLTGGLYLQCEGIRAWLSEPRQLGS